MRRRHRIVFDAPGESVRDALVATLGLTAVAGGELAGPLGRMPDIDARLTARVETDGPATSVELMASSDLRVPFFGWLVEAQLRMAARRALRYAEAQLRAAVAGDAPPPPPRRNPLLPPAPFTAEQATRLATVAMVGALANLGSALLTQNGDAVARAFHRSDRDLGLALAVVRIGVLGSLAVVMLADRVGRRRLMLVGLVGTAVANAVTAVAPNFVAFTGGQVVARAFANAAIIVASVAVIEEAPEGARAFSLAAFGLAFGLGFSASVALLPLADLGTNGWRLCFAVSAAAGLMVPMLARRLRETRRYDALPGTIRRGRIGEVFDRSYGPRFWLLGATAFLVNIFNAPSSQLTNRYLTSEHSFSNADVAVFRTVTAGLPGILGIVLGSHLAERIGRRPLATGGIVLATALQMTFFLAGGAWLWLAPVLSIVAASGAALAMGTLGAELFPTEVRGTSNGFLLVCGVAGGATGLVVATHVEHAAGGLGRAIALCGCAAMLAGVLLAPRLPETVERRLDDVSPSED